MIARPPTSNWIEPRWNLKTGSIHCRLVMIRIGIGCHGNSWMNLNGQESNIWRSNRLSSATYITAAEQRYFGSCDRFWQTTDQMRNSRNNISKDFFKKISGTSKLNEFFFQCRTECVKSPEKFNFQRNRIVWLKSVKVVYRHKLTSAGERAKVWRLKRKIHKR